MHVPKRKEHAITSGENVVRFADAYKPSEPESSMTTEHVPRGRPRSTGAFECGRMAAKIRIKWPDGPICGICFTTALRTRSECPLCGHDGLLPGKDEAGTNICFDCAGIATNMTCDNCGAEAERFRGGHCIRCVLRTDLSNVLNPNSPPDLRLKRLINILAEADRPESVYSWKRRTLAAELLDRIGTRDIALSHDAFDALPASKAVEYLRELLVHHGILTERDRQLAAFKRWLEHRLDSLAAIPHIHSPIE